VEEEKLYIFGHLFSSPSGHAAAAFKLSKRDPYVNQQSISSLKKEAALIFSIGTLLPRVTERKNHVLKAISRSIRNVGGQTLLFEPMTEKGQFSSLNKKVGQKLVWAGVLQMRWHYFISTWTRLKKIRHGHKRRVLLKKISFLNIRRRRMGKQQEKEERFFFPAAQKSIPAFAYLLERKMTVLFDKWLQWCGITWIYVEKSFVDKNELHLVFDFGEIIDW
jgi:hypothetical protein